MTLIENTPKGMVVPEDKDGEALPFKVGIERLRNGLSLRISKEGFCGSSWGQNKMEEKKTAISSSIKKIVSEPWERRLPLAVTAETLLDGG